MAVRSPETEMDARLRDLIEQLAARVPPEDITDADIDREVKSVRDATRRTSRASRIPREVPGDE